MENSKILLKRALTILNNANIDETNWGIGGGTVLSQSSKIQS